MHCLITYNCILTEPISLLALTNPIPLNPKMSSYLQSFDILIYAAGRKADLAKEAEKRARMLDSQETADSKLDVKVKVLLIGVSGGWDARAQKDGEGWKGA